MRGKSRGRINRRFKKEKVFFNYMDTTKEHIFVAILEKVSMPTHGGGRGSSTERTDLLPGCRCANSTPIGKVGNTFTR